MTAPWVLFEAGALAIAKRRRLIICMVSGSVATLPSPLQAFNAVKADRAGAKKIFAVLREEVGRPSGRFSLLWPRLSEMLSAQRVYRPTGRSSGPFARIRSHARST